MKRETDPRLYEALEKGLSGNMTRSQVMSVIQSFINSSYELSVSPLRLLRERFPWYSWKMFENYDPFDLRKFREVADDADFIWYIVTDWNKTLEKGHHWVTATHSAKHTHSCFMWEEQPGGYDREFLLAFSSTGIKFVNCEHNSGLELVRFVLETDEQKVSKV